MKLQNRVVHVLFDSMQAMATVEAAPGSYGHCARNLWVEDKDGVVDVTRQSKSQSHVITITTETKSVKLDMSKSAFLIVDMQNDFCHPNGRKGQLGRDVSGGREPIKPISSLLKPMRELKVPIVWVNWGYASVCSCFVSCSVHCSLCVCRNRSDLLATPPQLLHSFKSKGVGLGDPLPKTPEHRVLIKDSFDSQVCLHVFSVCSW